MGRPHESQSARGSLIHVCCPIAVQGELQARHGSWIPPEASPRASSENGSQDLVPMTVTREEPAPCGNSETGRTQGSLETEAAYLVDERVGTQCLNSRSIMSE
jgi:hypothetical protein